MNLQRLAAKQKRYLDIRRAVDELPLPSEVQSPLTEALVEYKVALAAIWSKQSVSAEDEEVVDSLERRLETLYNEARLLAKPSLTRSL